MSGKVSIVLLHDATALVPALRRTPYAGRYTVTMWIAPDGGKIAIKFRPPDLVVWMVFLTAANVLNPFT
jgi:hypothetical protein